MTMMTTIKSMTVSIILLSSSFCCDVTALDDIVDAIHNPVEKTPVQFRTATTLNYVRSSTNPNDVLDEAANVVVSSFSSSSSSSSSSVSRDVAADTDTTVMTMMMNPYTLGCLHTNELVSQIRVCNSEDPPDAAESGKCRTPPIDYMEIRINVDNWESITFEAWILQILLSELLDVPTTIEPGSYAGSLNFYHPDAPMEYGEPGSNDSLRRAYEIGDCRYAAKDKDNYQACTHIDPERWTGIQHSSKTRDLVHEGIAEPPMTLGTLGLESWFVTKFSVKNDPTLVSYLGLMGEENRVKLAETFLRPTSWQDYCELISTNNCTAPDLVAQRSPETVEENEQFFSEGYYTGHFRATEDNNCTANPTTCTGHVADFPCGWNSYMLPQIHYLNIALKSTGPEGPAGGYPYERLVEMWKAANATKSNLMMQYWSPEPLYQSFLGTDAEFISVTLPTRTQECLESRRPLDDMCSEDEAIRLGEPEGICEESSKPLWKVLVGNLYDRLYDPTIPLPIRSPAYDALAVFQISELQLGQIFDYRSTEPTPRDAVCRWVSENLDYLQTFIPRSYPRTIRSSDEISINKNSDSDPIVYIATVVGGITTVVVIVTWILVYRRREVHAFRMAQTEFLYLLLAGSLLIGFGAIIVGLPPSTATCATAIWFVNLGYTLELVPLIVKVAAVNRLMGAARQFRRIVLTRKSLFGAVFGISAMVSIFLLIWTIIDPPDKSRDYSLTNDVITDSMGNNRTVVDVVYYCSSDSSVWDYIAVGWNVVLLLCATVLAVQTRTVQKDFNESQTLAFLIYSHFLFVVLRLIVLMMSSGESSTVNESTLSGLRSLIFSVDTLATIVIYFLPKFLANKNDPNRSMLSSFSGFSNTNLSGSMGGGGSSSNSNNVFTTNLIRRQSSKHFKPKPQQDVTVTEKDVTETSLNQLSRASILSVSRNVQSELIKEDDELEENADCVADQNNNDVPIGVDTPLTGDNDDTTTTEQQPEVVMPPATATTADDKV